MSTRDSMPARVGERLHRDLHTGRAARNSGDVAEAWRQLEEAHLLSQPGAWPHVRVHAAMLALAWRTRDRKELTGQLLRIIVAGPGSFTGRYPEGNTGRASIPAAQPMPVPDELRDLRDLRHG